MVIVWLLYSYFLNGRSYPDRRYIAGVGTPLQAVFESTRLLLMISSVSVLISMNPMGIFLVLNANNFFPDIWFIEGLSTSTKTTRLYLQLLQFIL